MADQDNDMTDPPSSPPEPRGNPLSDEIKSWSASSSLMDEWQFTSSPISGSPNPNRQVSAREQSGQEDLMDDGQELDGEDGESQDGEDGMDHVEPELPTSMAEEIVEDSVLIDRPGDALPLATSDATTSQLPSTPPQFLRALRHRETPRSDNDVFVDAPASPLPGTPRRSQRAVRSSLPARSSQRLSEHPQDASLEFSELDESGLLRLVVELDSGRLDSSHYRQLTDSPDHKLIKAEDALDCIVVGSSAANSPEKPTATKSVSKPPVSPAKPASQIVKEVEEIAKTSSPAKSSSGKKKRGRASSKSQKGGKKRKRQETEGASEAVADSQQNEAGDVIRLRNGRVAKKKRPSLEAVEQRPRKEEIASSSLEISSQDAAVAQDVNMQDAADAQVSEEYEVQSQLALEVEARSVREQTGESHVEMSGALQTEAAEASAAEEENASPAEAQAQEEQETEADQAKEGGIFARIMTSLQGGLNVLRTAKLSREEVYKVEDMFMDMKRELFEAERRGRAS